MGKISKDNSAKQSAEHSLNLGEYAHQIIEEQYRRIIKQDQRVLDDKNPEHLHHMRVGTRRLRTALQVFNAAIDLPKAASTKRLRKLAQSLGAVRDLDVQMASLQDEYQPHLGKREQKQLTKALEFLHNKRAKAVNKMKRTLSHSRYQALKTAYETWLEQPEYTAVESLSLTASLPDLLDPLLSTLLLHPGWLISVEQATGESTTLHDLRKVCKHVRYQAEFFTLFYGEEFGNWVQEVKEIQDSLGKFQDTQVLVELLAKALGKTNSLPGLQAVIQQKQIEALKDWEATRQRYLDPTFRNQLRQMLLQTNLLVEPEQPESIALNETAGLN
jgi:CHAD domain-containing protein